MNSDTRIGLDTRRKVLAAARELGYDMRPASGRWSVGVLFGFTARDANGYYAELFAAVLHEYGAATTIGTNTVGKGYYQNLFQLEDGSAVDLSVGRYFTSKGENLEGIGLTPDVEVDLSDEDYAALYYGTLAQEDDAQLQAAVELLMENVVTP